MSLFDERWVRQPPPTPGNSVASAASNPFHEDVDHVAPASSLREPPGNRFRNAPAADSEDMLRRSISEKIAAFISLGFWGCIIGMTIYLWTWLHRDGASVWTLWHSFSSSCLLLGAACLGLYVELHQAWTSEANDDQNPARRSRLGRLAPCGPALHLILFVLTGGFVAAGPWSEVGSEAYNQTMTIIGHVLCIGGLVIGLLRVCAGCWKHRLRRTELKWQERRGQESSQRTSLQRPLSQPGVVSESRRTTAST